MVKNPPAHAGDIRDVGSIPGLGRSPGEGNGSPLQYSCLEDFMHRGTWQATVRRLAKNRTKLKPHSTRTVTGIKCSINGNNTHNSLLEGDIIIIHSHLMEGEPED